MSNKAFAALAKDVAAERDARLDQVQSAPAWQRPSRKNVRKVTFVVPEGVHRDLRIFALKRDKSLQSVMTEALEAYLAAHEAGFGITSDAG